jgi:hypothetical protein
VTDPGALLDECLPLEGHSRRCEERWTRCGFWCWRETELTQKRCDANWIDMLLLRPAHVWSSTDSRRRSPDPTLTSS